MNKMLDNIVQLIQQAKKQHDELQTQVEKMVNDVSGIGEGDLRIQAEVSSSALGILAESFNYMIEELGSLVIRVKTVAHEVSRSTTGILTRMSQLVEIGGRPRPFHLSFSFASPRTICSAQEQLRNAWSACG